MPNAARRRKNSPARRIYPKGVKMTKSHEGCWLDVFEKPWFAGKLLRLRGPGRFGPIPSAGSVIVGPNARVIPLGNHRKAPLLPRQIIPDMPGNLKEFQLTHVG